MNQDMTKKMLTQAKNSPPKNVPISQGQIMEKMGRMDWAEMTMVIQLQEKIQMLEKQKTELQQQLNQEVKP